MKYFTLIFIFLGLLLYGCAEEKKPTANTETVKLPEMLKRPTIISPVEEEGLLKQRYNEFAAAIKLDPSNLSARLDLTELMMAEARISGEHGYYYPAALGLVEDVLKSNPDNTVKVRALCDKAAVHLSQHEFGKALEIGRQALELNPYMATIYGILVDANVELGNYPKAVEMADKMIQLRPDLRSYSRVSYLREIHGDVDGAIEAMKLAVSSGFPGAENTGWARLTLGTLYQEYGHLDSARMQFRTALEERQDYPFAIAALAELDGLEGNTGNAIAQMERAASKIPEVGFYIELASWAKEEGDTEKYDSLTREIMVMLEDDVASGHNMDLEYAHLYLDLLEDPSEALGYALNEYEKRPENIFVNQLLAEIYFTLGQLDLAKPHLDRAMATHMQNPDLLQLELLLAQNTRQEKWLGDASPYQSINY